MKNTKKIASQFFSQGYDKGVRIGFKRAEKKHRFDVMYGVASGMIIYLLFSLFIFILTV